MLEEDRSPNHALQRTAAGRRGCNRRFCVAAIAKAWAVRRQHFVIMKTNRFLVSGLVGVLALISAAYCFWLMTVPLSYDLVYICSDWICRIAWSLCHRADRFIYLRHAFASVTSCPAKSTDHAARLTT